MTALAIRIGSALVLAASVVTPAAAQVAVRARGRVVVRAGPVRADVEVRTRRDRGEYRRGDDGYSTYRRGPYRRSDYVRRTPRVRNAYYFCSEGHGHPAYGWAWCVDGGYVRPHYGGRWVAVYDQRMEFRHVRGRRRVGHLDERALREVIGREELHWLRARSRGTGRHGRLHGEWIYLGDGGRSLGVYAGRTPIAELRDQNCDGYVDVTFLRRR